MNVVIQHRGEQIVRGGDRSEVAGEMQIDIFHRDDLRVASSGCTALHSEHGAEARFAQTNDSAFAGAGEHKIQPVTQPDGRSGFSFASRRRADRCDQYQFAVWATRERRQKGYESFALVRPNASSWSPGMFSFCAITLIGCNLAFLGNFDVGEHGQEV